MPAAVDKAIKEVMAKGNSEASAIRELKAVGAIRQKGKHLALGGKKKKRNRGMKARNLDTSGDND